MNITPEKLTSFVSNIFSAAGCNDDEAATIARRLVEANLVGHDSHGVIRVSHYIRWQREGKVKANQQPTVVMDTGCIGLIDANLGYGQVMGQHAMGMAIEKAKEHAVAVVGLRNSGHVGRVGDWVEMAADAGMIALCCVNTTGLGMLTAPFGGIDRRLSANPFAAGIPVAGSTPIILDISCSAIAEGKLKVALNKGVEVPDNCIIDSNGQPTNDPQVFYGDPPGAILSFGGHKGFGLGMVVEILAGALTGGRCTHEGVQQLEQGMLSIVIDPGKFQEVDAFSNEIQQFVTFVKGSRTVTPDGTILMPGEPEQRTRADRQANGIELDDTTWGELTATAEAIGAAQ